jgi:hypothetical protein
MLLDPCDFREYRTGCECNRCKARWQAWRERQVVLAAERHREWVATSALSAALLKAR